MGLYDGQDLFGSTKSWGDRYPWSGASKTPFNPGAYGGGKNPYDSLFLTGKQDFSGTNTPDYNLSGGGGDQKNGDPEEPDTPWYKKLWDWMQSEGEGENSGKGLNDATLLALQTALGFIPGQPTEGAQHRKSYGEEANRAALGKMNTFGNQIQEQITGYQPQGFDQQLPQRLQGSDQVRALLGIAQGGGPPVNT